MQPEPAAAGVAAYIGLGANLGDPRAALTQAADALRAWPGIAALRLSPLYRSAPIDSSGPDYLNAVAAVQTTLAPHALLEALQAIEAAHRRERPYRNAPRTLDLDLLLYGAECIGDEALTVPHPRMHERAFVLRPLADLAPALSIPGRGPLADWLPRVAGQVLELLP